MLELRDISFTYDTEPVLDSVSFVLDEGELLLVAGRTGIGKSTLLGVIAGSVPRYSGGLLTGDLLLNGESILQRPPRERAHLIGYVGQDPAAGFVTDTVEEELAFGMEQLGTSPSTMRRRVEETLDLLGIAELRSRDLRTLSGGQQQRVAIGSVLTMHPRVLVLDEPTSALDPTAAEDVLATLARLVDDLGLAVVLAEHRLERVLPFTDRVGILADATLRIGEPAEMLKDSPVAPPIVELGRALGWDPLPMSVREARKLAKSHSLVEPVERRPEPVEGTTSADKSGFEARSARTSTSVGDRSARTSTGEIVLAARRVSVTRGRNVVLREVDLTLSDGRVTALMGRNGSGKSTLIWALQGTLARTTGDVTVAGEDPHQLDAAGRRALIGLVPQSADDLLYLETVAQECAAVDEGAQAKEGTARALLDRLAPGIPDDSHPRDLSQGQRLALVLAIVLSTRPGVLLLDEPTRGLDYAGKAQLAAILRDLADQGRGVLVATHDVEFVAQAADDVAVLAEGELVSVGPVREVLVESPSFAPQVTKILGPPWLRVSDVVGPR